MPEIEPILHEEGTTQKRLLRTICIVMGLGCTGIANFGRGGATPSHSSSLFDEALRMPLAKLGESFLGDGRVLHVEVRQLR